MMLAVIDHYTAQISQLTPRSRSWPGLTCPDQPARRRARHRDDLRQDIIADRHRHGGVPHRLPPGVLGGVVTAGPAVRRETQRQQPNRPQQPLPGAALGQAGISAGNTQSFLGARYRKPTRRMPRRKPSSPRQLHAHHRPRTALPPAAVYTDLGAHYYQQRMHARPTHPTTSRAWKSLPLSHHRSHRPGNPPAHRGQLTTAPKTRRMLTRHRVLPRAQPRLDFRPAESRRFDPAPDHGFCIVINELVRFREPKCRVPAR